MNNIQSKTYTRDEIEKMIKEDGTFDLLFKSNFISILSELDQNYLNQLGEIYSNLNQQKAENIRQLIEKLENNFKNFEAKVKSIDGLEDTFKTSEITKSKQYTETVVGILKAKLQTLHQ